MVVTEERHETDEWLDADDHDAEWDVDDSTPVSDTDHDVINPSFWQIIRRFFYKTARERDQERQTRLYMLNEAIGTYPQAAVNYMLRGELYLELQATDAARRDFETAIELAATQYDNDRWGLSAQTIQDRSQRSLQRIG